MWSRRPARPAHAPDRPVRRRARTAPAKPAWRLPLRRRRRRAQSRTALSRFPAASRTGFRNASAAPPDRGAAPGLSTRSGNEATCSKVWRAIAASVSASKWCAVVASGASDGNDGKAIACADGCAPRNGGGGMLVWNVTSSPGRCRSAAVAGRFSPISSKPSCSEFSAAAAAAREPCGSGISCGSMSGDRDGAAGAMRQSLRSRARRGRALRRGSAERRQQRLTKHDQRGLQIRDAGAAAIPTPAKPQETARISGRRS